MTTIQVSASRTYDVVIGRGLCDTIGQSLISLHDFNPNNICVLSDSNVFPLYGERVMTSLKNRGYHVLSYVFDAGEASKNPTVLMDFLNFLCQNRLSRWDAIVALGGGVVGDLGGLAASLYLRGIPCVQMPTSLLAMVDSSVGGKTAINLDGGKNQVGSFTQPHLVLCDLDCLSTLPAPVLSEGWAEIIKYGMIFSEKLLTQLETADVYEEIEDIVAQCVSLKRDVVATDERDTGARQLLNFGHTLGHAVELSSHYQIFHGEGVAIGMAVFTRACAEKGLCPPECQLRLDALLDRFHLPKNTDFPLQELMDGMMADKKRNGGHITLVVPAEVGQCKLYPTTFPFVKHLLQLGL